VPDYLSDTQIPELIRRLHNATADGKLDWEKGRDEYVFACSVGKFGYSLLSRDQDDYAPFVLRVFDERQGVEVGEVLQEIETSEGSGYNTDLFDLYWLVKRRTLNLDQVAAEIFDALDALDSPE
jgi:hypothetical protein